MVLGGLAVITLERQTLARRMGVLQARPWLVTACLLAGVSGAGLDTPYDAGLDPSVLLLACLVVTLHPITAVFGVFLAAQQLCLHLPLSTWPEALRMGFGLILGGLVALGTSGARGPALTALGAAALGLLAAAHRLL